MLELNRIYNEDCLVGMKDIETESIDLVVTDPPYPMNYTSGSSTSVGKAERWQGNLKAGDTTANIVNNIKFEEWLPEVYRIMKSQSHCYIFVNDKNVYKMLDGCFKAGFKLHNILVWYKNNCTPNRWYMKNCEFILFLHKGKSFPINNLGTPQVLQYENISGKNKEHPTQKPVELIKVFIENSSNENDIVFDPFMGCGTTARAAEHLHRNYLGFEIDEQYIN